MKCDCLGCRKKALYKVTKYYNKKVVVKLKACYQHSLGICIDPQFLWGGIDRRKIERIGK